MKTAIKKFEKSLTEGKEEASKRLNTAIKAIDKAMSKGVIKKNTASRYKSSITKKFNELNK